MKKMLSAMVAAVLAAGLISGCGANGSSGAGEASKTDKPTETTAAAPSSDKKETTAAGSAAGGGAIKIGATYYSLQNEFTMRMDNAGKKYCKEQGIEFYSYDGNYDAATQLQQVETMIENGVDAIILNPQDAVACAAAVELAHKNNIPVVGVNTMVESDLLTSYVGSQDVSAGEDIMKYMIDYMGKDAFNIVIIEGPMGQSAQLQRIEGIENILKTHPNVKELARNTANWSRSEAMTLMETWLNTYGDDIHAVIAENDEMALGARQAIEAAGKNIPCIGVDGIADAVTAVGNGSMIASDFQNAEGQMTGAIETAVKVVKGETVEKTYWIPFEMITPENYKDYIDKY